MGFYRPLVSWSFAANRAIAGLSPLGYALVNLTLVCGIAASIVALCRALGFTRMEGLFAASVWTSALTLALPLVLAPVYWGRSVFARNDAELSARVLARVFGRFATAAT